MNATTNIAPNNRGSIEQKKKPKNVQSTNMIVTQGTKCDFDSQDDSQKLLKNSLSKPMHLISYQWERKATKKLQ
jgi:hypothetical protein